TRGRWPVAQRARRLAVSNATATQRTGDAGRVRWFARLGNSYALILIFILVDYVAASVAQSAWARVIVAVLLSLTLVLAFRIARAPGIWVSLSVIFMCASTLAAIGAALVPQATDLSQVILGVAGTPLLLAPVVILGRIAASTYVSGETILGAICVYLLYGM